MISNFDVFLSIAREAHSEMKRLDEEGRVPKPVGSSGFVVTWDPEQFDGLKARFAQSSADKAMHFLECVQRALGTAC